MQHKLVTLMALILSGCASVSHGPKQRVMVSSPGAPYARCTISSSTLGVQSFTTPEAFMIPRSSDNIIISCSKDCFEDAQKTFTPSVNGEDVASNGFFGGAAPALIDYSTKKLYNYNYDFIIEMKPLNKCRIKKKGFLDGNQKDFDNQIKDFSFDANSKSMPEESIKTNDFQNETANPILQSERRKSQ